MSPEFPDDASEQQIRPAWPAYLCALVVLVAIVAEFIGGRGGPSVADGDGASISPATWPDAARTIEWLLVAAAAAGYRAIADWVAHRAIRYWLAAISALPFLIWAYGVATSQDWATFR